MAVLRGPKSEEAGKKGKEKTKLKSMFARSRSRASARQPLRSLLSIATDNHTLYP